jgi:ABC-2 type transport system permease protein
MSGFFTLIRKQLAESRWVLGLSALALFGFSWLSVYATAYGQIRMARELGGEAKARAAVRMLRTMGGSELDVTTAALEMLFWVHPFFVMTVVIWAISRASLAVAGEVERGTMDLVLSRPVSRTSYFGSQVFVAVLGMLVLAVAAILGNLIGSKFNAIETPPPLVVLLRPAGNLVALAWAVFGYTLLFSAVDRVRWRPMMIGSVATLAGYVAFFVAPLPPLEGTAWKTWLERLSIFTAYNPVKAVGAGKDLMLHLAVLGGVGMAGILIGLVAFRRRDLPTSG